MFTIGIVCGGSTQERGISLNSARTLIDHIQIKDVLLKIFFVDASLAFHLIPSSSLYSNTPSDFDFKINAIAKSIPKHQLSAELKRCAMIFPVVHGPFGEDGGLQKLLEAADVPFVGSSSTACARAYPKNSAQQHLKAKGFTTLPFCDVSADTSDEKMLNFWHEHCRDGAIMKPNRSGSSIGVVKINTLSELLPAKNKLVEQFGELQLQAFCRYRELTIIVTTNTQQEPIALVPTETLLTSGHSEIYDYRAKYLPTNACQLHTPADLSQQELQACRTKAEAIFTEFELSDFARLDGWYCPNQGFICTDINIISGFEENSFLFKQASTCGFSHSAIIRRILTSACARHNMPLPVPPTYTNKDKQLVYVICGGASSERQVSLMSGRNTWFKLRSSTRYTPVPLFMDTEHTIWRLPDTLFLHHTVEEIMSDIDFYSQKLPVVTQLAEEVLSRHDCKRSFPQTIEKMTIESWLSRAQAQRAKVLLALHGGIGENGVLQRRLHALRIPFNGSSEITSSLCMDKRRTISKIESLNHPDIDIQTQLVLSSDDLERFAKDIHHTETFWSSNVPDSQIMIIKPLSDGCSSGIVCIVDHSSLQRYATFIHSYAKTAPANTFYNQPSPIELPRHSKQFLLEPYIVTDGLSIKDAKIQHKQRTGWLELTIVIREKKSDYWAFNPSITISEHAVLSVEEKFQGGTGINLTPPPLQLLDHSQVDHIKRLVCLIGQEVGIRQYARLDIFYNALTNRLQLIEINTLPALTPSTVLFQQALAETPPVAPVQFIEQLIDESVAELTA